MSDATIQTLFRSLEHTIRERLDGIQEVMVSRFTNSVNYANSANSINSINSANYIPSVPYYSGANVNYIPGQESALISRIISLEASVQLMRNELNTLRELTQSTGRDASRDAARDQARDILPLNPIDGIEVIPKREVVLETDTEPLSYADRLLLNKKARKALEAEEMGEADKYPLNPEDDEDEAAEVAEEDEGEAAEEEGEAAVEDEGEAAEEEGEAAEEEGEAAEEEEGEAEELEEFLYKGSTYYRDSENNVFTTDEDGELVDTPVGKWNAERKRIVVSTA